MLFIVTKYYCIKIPSSSCRRFFVRGANCDISLLMVVPIGSMQSREKLGTMLL